MKIIITENQIKLLKKSLLLETSDDPLTYTTKYDQTLFLWDERWDGVNYSDWQKVPAGTKFFFDGTYVSAWKGSLIFGCDSGQFYARGYRFVGEALSNALQKKFCSGVFLRKEVADAFNDKQIEGNLSKLQDQTCINKIKEPYKNAVNWWKNKLNEPAFYEKLKKLNNYTDQQTKEWITKYKNYLTNNISGPFCPSKTSKWYKENLKNDVIAHLAGNVGTSRVVYNVIYKDEPSKDIESTFVHEIQHALYDLKPMTPDTNWKKVFPYKVWGGNVVSNSESTSPKEKTTISKYGLDQNVINYWKNQVKRQTDPKKTTDTGYLCRITELASRVVTMKNLLNKKTKDKITVDEFKKFLKRDEVPYNDENAYWLCLCWVNNGMEDIQTFLDNLDKYVVAKAGDNTQDNIT